MIMAAVLGATNGCVQQESALACATMQKEIAKMKKILHPNSRKTIAIAKKTTKMSNRQKAKMAGAIKQNLIGEKMLWIRDHLVPDVCPYTPELTADLLLRYIARNDEELEQIAIKHSIGGRRGRQHASREDIIKMTKEREQEEFNTCGIEIPDILISKQCEMLRTWNGELRLLPNFKFRRFGKKHLRDALQRIEKQPKTAVEKSTDCTESSISRVKNNKSADTKNRNIQNTVLNTALPEKTILSECPMDIE